MKKVITVSGIILFFVLIYQLSKDKKPTTPRSANVPNGTGGNTNTGGGNTGTGGETGGGGTGGGTPDNFTYLYQYGSNYVRYKPTANIFEKTAGVSRDNGRRMMPIDLFSWCIANRNRNKLIFCNYRIKDSNGAVIFEAYDTEGAVHVSLAQNDRENNRGNNHQEQYSRFLIKEGTYTIEFSRLNGSVGVPQLYLVEQHDGNQFKCLVGNSVGQTVGSVDNIGIGVNDTYTATFTISFIDEDNCIIKGNANGFDD